MDEDIDDAFVDLGDDIEEFSTPISSEDTPIIMEFTVVFHDSTLSPHEVTPAITEFVDAFPEDPVDEEVCEGEDITHNCIKHTPLIHLPIVSTVFSQLGEKNYEKESAIFYTITEIRDKNYKVNLDNGSCINAAFSKLIEKILPHPHPFKVPWIKFKP